MQTILATVRQHIENPLYKWCAEPPSSTIIPHSCVFQHDITCIRRTPPIKGSKGPQKRNENHRCAHFNYMLIVVTNVDDVDTIFFADTGSMVPTSFIRHTDAHSSVFGNLGIQASESMDWETAVEFLLALSPQPPAFVSAASNFSDDPPNNARFSELERNNDQLADTLYPGSTSDTACQDQITHVDMDTIQQSERNNTDLEAPRKRFESFVHL